VFRDLTLDREPQTKLVKYSRREPKTKGPLKSLRGCEGGGTKRSPEGDRGKKNSERGHLDARDTEKREGEEHQSLTLERRLVEKRKVKRRSQRWWNQGGTLGAEGK